MQISWQAKHLADLELQSSWQAQNLEVQISWHAQHLVNLDVQASWQAQLLANLEVQISWQAKHLVNLDVQAWWQAQRLVNLEALCEPRSADFVSGTAHGEDFLAQHLVNLEVQISWLAQSFVLSDDHSPTLNLLPASLQLCSIFQVPVCWLSGKTIHAGVVLASGA